MTLAALLVSTLSLAQFTPYNPDADNDQFVGAQDLLAFLPLFGEDWDLDSLVIYGVTELSAPEWCDLPGNQNSCLVDKVVPQDADVVYFEGEPSITYHLILPEMPKPFILFGGYDEPQIYPLDRFNEDGPIELKTISAADQQNFTILTGFGGQWYIQR